jgi:hypothetical protein
MATTANGLVIPPDLKADNNPPADFKALAESVDATYGGNVANAGALPAAGKFPGQRVWLVDVKGWGVWDGTKWVTDTAWVTPALSNSWVAYDTTQYRAPQYRRWNGRTEIRGVMKSGSQATVFTLPAGFRPGGTGATGTEQFITVSNVGGSTRVDVAPNGTVTVLGYSSGGSNASVSLSGIAFSAEQ